MRYLPRPIGQRWRTWTQAPVYSLTRPLMAATALDTLIDLPEKIWGRVEPPMPRPSAGLALTAPMAATVEQHVTDGGQGAALALGDVVLDLIGGGHGVGLQGEVVVSDLLALALHDLEHVVSGALDGLVELDLQETLGVLQVLGNALLHSLGLGLTNADGTVEGLVEVSLHGLGLLLNQLAVGGVGLGNVVDDAGEAGHAVLGLLGVGSHGVGEHDDLGVELGLGAGELVLGGELGSGSGGVESANVLHVLLLHVGHLLVEGLGGLGQVLGHLDAVVAVLLAQLGELGVEVGGQGLHLLSSGLLVLVHEHTELAH